MREGRDHLKGESNDCWYRGGKDFRRWKRGSTVPSKEWPKTWRNKVVFLENGNALRSINLKRTGGGKPRKECLRKGGGAEPAVKQNRNIKMGTKKDIEILCRRREVPEGQEALTAQMPSGPWVSKSTHLSFETIGGWSFPKG